MCTSGMPIRITLKAYDGQEDPNMRKLSEGESSPKPPQKPALTSRNTENPRRIRADSAGVLKYETPGSHETRVHATQRVLAFAVNHSVREGLQRSLRGGLG